MKNCSRCDIDKPLSGYTKDKSTKDGLSRWCKDCKSLSDKRYRTGPGGFRRDESITKEIDEKLFANGRTGRSSGDKRTEEDRSIARQSSTWKYKYTLKTGNIYVVEFSTGAIKIGHSSNIESRVYTHKSLAEALGIDVLNTYVSPQINNCFEVESMLIKWCIENNADQRLREYFHNMKFVNVVNFVKSYVDGSFKNPSFVMSQFVKGLVAEVLAPAGTWYPNLDVVRK